MSESKAVQAFREAMNLCPEEFNGSVVTKGVWVAGFMRGYRFKNEEHSDAEIGGQEHV